MPILPDERAPGPSFKPGDVVWDIEYSESGQVTVSIAKWTVVESPRRGDFRMLCTSDPEVQRTPRDKDFRVIANCFPTAGLALAAAAQFLAS